MTDVSAVFRPFLESSGWHGADVLPLAGDLSSRLYFRLRKAENATAILMVDRSQATRDAFIRVGNWLRSLGLSAPDVYAEGPGDGMLLLEDFGDTKLTTLIAQAPERQSELVDVAVDLILAIQEGPGLVLNTPSPSELLSATRLIDEWYPMADTHALNEIRGVLGRELEFLGKTPAAVSLRDFHTDNLIWLPDRSGIARLGLLDFQDAFLAHPAYDLMSLVTDARIDVPRPISKAAIKRFATGTGQRIETVEHAVCVLGVQRNMRILGIFCRSAQRDGKAHHLPALSRVRAHLAFCLSHPCFEAVSALLDRAAPPLEGTPQ